MATETKTVIWRIVGQTVGMGALNTQVNAAGASMAKLALRAAAVIPLWVAMRAAVFALPRAISAATKEWVGFQAEMSRVATVTRATAEGFQVLENAIVESASKSKVSFKDTASVVYALGSAGLTATQQLEGFNHVINLSVGTGGNLEQTAKLVAGAVNVFGKSLKDATTSGEKFKKVADTIAYTYSTQQVELAELSTAMGYVASVGTLVDISFDDLVATIGVLNTGMLKGSKSGTSLVNAFIQLARKSDRLGELGIAVDTSKPLNFIEVMDKLAARVNDGKLSLEELSTIMSTFGIRGGRAVGLLINNYQKFKDVLAATGKESKDFAEIMKRMAEDNIPAQARKIRDSFTGIWMGVLDQVETPWMNFLKRIYDNLENFRARQNYLEDTGRKDETLGARLKKSVPAAGAGVAALLVGRGITPRIGLHPLIEARAGQMAQERLDQLSKSKIGGYSVPGKQGFQALTDQDRLSRMTGKASAAQFRGDALKEAVAARGGGIKGNVGVGLMHLGGALQNVAKGAVLAYGAMKLVQGILHQVGDPHTAAQWDKVVGAVEWLIGKAFKGIVWFFEVLGTSVGLWVNGLLKKVDIIKGAFNTFIESFKAFIDPILAIVAYFRNEISGKEALTRIKNPLSGLDRLAEERKVDKAKQDRLNAQVESQHGKTVKETDKDLLEKSLLDAAVEAVRTNDSINQTAADKKAREEGNTDFYQAMNGFFSQMDMAGASIGTDQLDSTRAKIAEAKELADAQSFGLLSFVDEMKAAFKDKTEGKLGDTEYGTKIIKIQAAMEGAIDKLERLGKITNADVVKARSGVTGKAAILAGGVDTEAFKKEIVKVVFQALGATEEQIQQSVEGTNTGAILQEFDANIKKVIADNQAGSLKLFGISDEVIAMQKFQAEFDAFAATKEASLAISQEEVTMSDFLVENSEKLRRIVTSSSGIREEIVALQMKGLELTRKEAEAMKEMGSYVKGAFKDVFKDIFETGDFDFSTAADKFGAALKTA